MGAGGTILATTGSGSPVISRLRLTPPAVPSRVRAGTRVQAWGTAAPALTAGQRNVVFWQHYIGGQWDMVLAWAPAFSYRTTATSTRYSVRIIFKPGRWRGRATATAVARDADPVTSAVRCFTVY